MLLNEHTGNSETSCGQQAFTNMIICSRLNEHGVARSVRETSRSEIPWLDAGPREHKPKRIDYGIEVR
jgi:hypothetical protein